MFVANEHDSDIIMHFDFYYHHFVQSYGTYQTVHKIKMIVIIIWKGENTAIGTALPLGQRNNARLFIEYLFHHQFLSIENGLPMTNYLLGHFLRF